MGLDLHTLFIANMLTALIASLVMLIIWLTSKSSGSLGWISLGFGCLLIGVMLIASQAYLPNFISVIIGNSMYPLWVVFVWQGTRHFQGLAFPLNSVLLSLLLLVCLLTYYTYIDFDTGMRIIVTSLFVAIYSIFTVLDLLKPIHNNSPSIEHQYTVAIVLFFIFSMLVRIAMVVIEKSVPNFISVDWLQQIYELIFMLYSVAFPLGFLWIWQRHVENNIVERADALQVANALTDHLRQTAENAALHDPLTLAGNRSKFEHNVNIERDRHLRHHHNLCLAFVDIDHFKLVNDKHGHDVGDQVLQSLVSLFTDIIRNIDKVYRWGGEEFIILLPETKLSEALLVCERIRKHVQLNLRVKDEGITISIGVSQLRGEESIRELVKRADKLLYTAKDSGRNCVIGE
ncbi:GGDEF domain-containing protein [Psychromonas antarctica]|uniref:GGDEF domain-containing protein n=1 Tax=Psychromonas antarctica TaxID=67573 RepID=UPI001EE945F1|nr:GGDEF domain-containing protein [Psychromonas antarctica]MCG6202046.1 GGDEF domain-containing protein [Psychromonas antarctica]